jgi:hypothetical protein
MVSSSEAMGVVECNRRSEMQSVVLNGHYDGDRILLDEPFEMKANTRVLVTVLPDTDSERLDWLRLSAERLKDAYGDDEPEYTLESVKEINPLYDRG